jgi:L-galactono-1,4-lactone dehydrogenase
VESRLVPQYNAAVHWAKVEPLQHDAPALCALQARLAARFPVDRFNAARVRLDPHNVLGNEIVEAMFPRATAEDEE